MDDNNHILTHSVLKLIGREELYEKEIILSRFLCSCWRDCPHHLHPGLLYQRQRVLHRHLPRGHLPGHHAFTQHEANGNGGQVRIFLVYIVVLRLTAEAPASQRQLSARTLPAN